MKFQTSLHVWLRVLWSRTGVCYACVDVFCIQGPTFSSPAISSNAFSGPAFFTSAFFVLHYPVLHFPVLHFPVTHFPRPRLRCLPRDPGYWFTDTQLAALPTPDPGSRLTGFLTYPGLGLPRERIATRDPGCVPLNRVGVDIHGHRLAPKVRDENKRLHKRLFLLLLLLTIYG